MFPNWQALQIGKLSLLKRMEAEERTDLRVSLLACAKRLCQRKGISHTVLRFIESWRKRIEISRALTAENYVPRLKVLHRETKRVKFDGTEIVVKRGTYMRFLTILEATRTLLIWRGRVAERIWVLPLFFNENGRTVAYNHRYSGVHIKNRLKDTWVWGNVWRCPQVHVPSRWGFSEGHRVECFSKVACYLTRFVHHMCNTPRPS